MVELDSLRAVAKYQTHGKKRQDLYQKVLMQEVPIAFYKIQ